MVADSQRTYRPSPASATAITAIRIASPTTVSTDLPPTIASTTRPARTGVATANSAPSTLITRKSVSSRLCGAANEAIRFSVARENELRSCVALLAWNIDIHAVVSMSMTGPVPPPFGPRKSARSLRQRR